MIRIIKKKIEEKIIILFMKLIKKINGINKVISISKIKKIKLIIKNWILNGIRLLDIGSNPHSNGEIFSRSENDFFPIKKLINIKINAKIIKIILIKKIEIIIYINLN